MQMNDIHQRFLKSDGVCTDTRKLFKNCFFVALKGERFDGDQFVDQALEAGASAVLCSKEVALDDHRLIKVDDALETLQDLARFHRATFNFPLIAITGSNGKTTTKELMRDVLATRLKVQATLGNLNNHIGVPLTLLSFSNDLDVGIVEMGANHQKEIAFLCSIATPDFGYITNIGKAHLEGFGGVEGVKKGKKELFDYLVDNGEVFVPELDPVLMDIAKANKKIHYFGKDHVPQMEYETKNGCLSIRITDGDSSATADTQLSGAYNAGNALAAIAVGKHFGVSIEDACKAIAAYVPENNRSQMKQTASNALIMDAYNANPSSMIHALENLVENHASSAFAILGDMLEMGEYSQAEHQKIADWMKENNVQGILIGPEFGKVDRGGSVHWFESTNDADTYLKANPLQNKTILLKGSRGMAIEKLEPLL